MTAKRRSRAAHAAQAAHAADQAPDQGSQISDAHSQVASLRAQVGDLRSQVSDLRNQVEAAESAPTRSAQISEWSAARAKIRAVIQGVAPADLFAGLDAHVPVALLPVRLETRFADPGTDVLRVRIYPDDVHVDGHDEELTATELALGSALWTAAPDLLADGEAAPAEPPPGDNPAGRRARWAALVTSFGGPRAAWVAHATRPAADGTAPAPVVKAQAYVRPPVARALPDRWVVRVYAGGAVVGEAWTTPVGVDLHLAPDPAAVPAGSTGSTGSTGSSGSTDTASAGTDGTDGTALPVVDPELRWLIDYAEAVTAGMAVDVPLPAGTQSVDRVVAVGVRAMAEPADSATELASLLTAHRYTDGFGFLPIGSPTANTPDARSAGDRHVDPMALWQQEFGPAAASGTAAAVLASALGLPAGVVDGSDGSADLGDSIGRAMQTATWAATWGYYLGQLIDPSVINPSQIDAVRTHYLDHVRGRGTLPTVRIGRQPYGVLPLVPLDRWTADGASPTVDGLARLLTRVRPMWQYGVGQPVTSHEGPDFDAAFTAVMSTDAVARGYSIRSVVADRTVDPFTFTGIDPAPANGVVDAMIGPLLGLETNPLTLAAFSPTSQPVRAPMVVDPSDPTPDASVQAAIRALSSTNPHLVLTLPVWLTPRPQGPATLLHTMLRRSLLLEYATAGLGLGGLPELNVGGSPMQPRARALLPSAAATIAQVDPALLQSGMLVGLSPDPQGGFTPVRTLPNVLTSPLTAITGSVPAGEWLWRNPTQHPDVRRTLDETLAAMGVLATLTADDLEILLPETLDLATHRWTAWAESLAADKLSRLRAAAPTGITLGGWGAVEGVTRRARVAVDPAESVGAATGPLWADSQPGGFVHAPSTGQAATAAVLRAAHLAHGGEADPTCAIDLSSARTRTALQLAQGIRNGQALGALLGYELELDLHERGADVLIAGLRAYAPAWQASGTFVEGDAEEIVSPSAVADGLALSAADPAAVAARVLPVGGPPTLAAALAAALETLRQHQDALADLLTAEGIHQALAGNTARAGAALDAAHRGGLPPADFEVIRTPRSGISLTCRVGVLLATSATPARLAGGWPQSPRGQADAACAAWLASVLPPLARVRIRVSDAGGAVTDHPLPAAATIGPLDLVIDQPAVLQARLLLALPAGSRWVDGRDPAWTADTVSLGELLTAAADLREVVAARPLRSADLIGGTSTSSSTDTSVTVMTDERDAGDLQARLAAARTTLAAAAADVAASLPPLQAALAAGAVPPGVESTAIAALQAAMAVAVILQPPPDPTPADLPALLTAASAELARRLGVAAPGSTATADDLIAALKGLLGSAQPAVPLLLLDPDTVAIAQPGLTAGDRFLAAEPELAADWLDDVGGVRVGAGHAVTALQDCEALTAGRGLPDGWRIVDPGNTSSTWSAALGVADLATSGPATTVVLRAATGAAFAAGRPICGLVVDEWVEVVPQAVAATSVAYQAEAPAARAPQAILLGVAPDLTHGWDVDTIVDLALEALSLSAIRTVDTEKGAWIGRMLPAVVLPDGDATDVIAAPPLLLMQVDPALLAAARTKLKELG